MSGEALYERYKEALKRGHVASLRGRLEDALAAYGEAASIAPERATPYTSAGTALLRRKRSGDAIRQFDLALRMSPHDEPALLGRAQALASLDRRIESAEAFDTLAETRIRAGKLADAVDAARRGLEMAEGRGRRRTLERLIAQLRASEPGEPGRLAMERALRVLEGPAVVAEPGESADVQAATDDGVVQLVADVVDQHAAGTADGAAADDPPRAGEIAHGGHGPASDVEPGEDEPSAPADLEPAPVAEPEVVLPVLRRALDRDLPPDADPLVLEDEVEVALSAADFNLARERLLDLAAYHRREDRFDAALEACYQALSVDPDSISLHLALVELYDARGLTALAEEKLHLMAGLAELDGDADAAGRIALTRSSRA